jgi:serine/threonine protein kinase
MPLGIFTISGESNRADAYTPGRRIGQVTKHESRDTGRFVPRMPLATGTTFAGYTILRLLGSGGMAEVYLAQHPRLPRRDALKVMSEAITADTDFRERFHREADLASTL